MLAQAQSRIMSRRSVSRPIVPTDQPSAGLAAVKAASRRLRRWPAASLDRGCARRSQRLAVGTKKTPRSNQETETKQPGYSSHDLTSPNDLLTAEPPYKDGAEG